MNEGRVTKGQILRRIQNLLSALERSNGTGVFLISELESIEDLISAARNECARQADDYMTRQLRRL